MASEDANSTAAVAEEVSVDLPAPEGWKKLGMASGLETLCGQAFEAKQHHMLGIYLQRPWIILHGCAILLLPLYIFTTPILRLLGQDKSLAKMVINGHLGWVRSSGFDPSNSWFLLFGRVIVFAPCIGCIVFFI